MIERVDIKVGFYCNNLCKFCVQGRKRDYLPAKDWEEIKAALIEAYQTGKREVVFTGGEPCLHPEIVKLISIAKKIGYQEIQLQSNGRMFAYKKFCLKTIKAGATQFSPALHGPNSEIHDYLTEAKGSYKQTVKGIKNLRALNQYVLTNSVITSSNYKYLPELAELFVSLGVNQFQFAFVHILGTADKNKDWIVPRKSEIMPYVKRGLDIGIKAGIKVSTEAIPYCFMENYHDYVSESFIPETRIYDAGFVIKDFTAHRRDSGKIKHKKCAQCKYDKICEGPWREYIELFGWDEFIPVI